MEEGFLVVAPDGQHVFVNDRPRVVPWLGNGLLLTADVGGVRQVRGVAEGEGAMWPRDRAAVVDGVRVTVHHAWRNEEGRLQACLGDSLVSASEAMFRVFHRATALAGLDAPVLILGESGTGKELIARAIHEMGRGASAPYVPVNMAALPSELAEAELFGWERGAFSGATASRVGHFESADRGTLFLDEIAEASPSLQAKLLRVLDGGMVQRLGASRALVNRARVLAATHVDLWEASGQGAFRLDLLQRLGCFVIRVPALRGRREDVPAIASWLCRALPGAPRLDVEAGRILSAQSWPGNVRQLRNVLARAGLYSAGRNVTTAAVQEALMDEGAVWSGLSGAVVRAPCRAERIRASGIPRSTYYYRLKRGLL